MFCYYPKLTAYDWKNIYNNYKKIVADNDIVLEIGASNLKKTRDLAKYCKKLIGVELFPDRTPADFDNISYIVGDWQNLSDFIRPKSIDIVVSSHVIEHVPDDLRAINELFIVLKPNGIALLVTPNRKRLTRAIIELFTDKRKFPYKEHQREYIEKDLISLLEKSKFQKYKIILVVFGLHAGPVYIYKKKVPKLFKQLANFWEIHLYK